MNREVKFRGIRTDNGKWVYGYYVKGSSRHCILPDLGGIQYEVITETVGELTGLKDKTGKDIYEGDIYKTWYSRDMSGQDIIFMIEAVEFEQTNERSGFDIPFINNAEIIGNIYETPYLLNSEQEAQVSDTTKISKE